MRTHLGALVAIALGIPSGLALAACSSTSEPGGASSTSTSTCGTVGAPKLLELTDVTPAAGASVPNSGVVHAFTVVAAPGLFTSLGLQYVAPEHTAGAADPSAWKITAKASGADVRYEAGPVSFANAPGHVTIASGQKFATADGCVYALPSPLFDYDVTPATPGGGGAGQGGAAQGGAGQGGEAQGGAGQGGAAQGGGGQGGGG
jgi:hypothetical protein